MTARALRPYLSYAMITFGTLSLTTIVQRVQLLLVNGFKGPYAAGLYAVAVQVSDLLPVVPAALGLVMFRRGARAVPDHYSEVVSVLRWTGAFVVAAALVRLGAMAGWLIPLVFGSHYRGSVEPLRLLLPGTVAFSLQSVLSSYLAGRGRPRIVLFAGSAGAVVGICADRSRSPPTESRGRSRRFVAVVHACYRASLQGATWCPAAGGGWDMSVAHAGSAPTTAPRPLLICFAGDRWEGNPHLRAPPPDAAIHTRLRSVIRWGSIPMRSIVTVDRIEVRPRVAKTSSWRGSPDPGASTARAERAADPAGWALG